jgi:hypothetical protein
VKKFVPPRPETVARVRALAERRLTPEEIAEYEGHAPSPEERAEARALIAWFRRRYPTARQRLAYARQAYARWMKHAPAG